MDNNALFASEAPLVELTPEQQKESMRVTRGFLLNECDWTQLSDTTLTADERQQWSVYRQQLRDITKDPNWPNVQWPTKPWPIYPE
jgi:hypothetical protein